jgi:hypothetical protein
MLHHQVLLRPFKTFESLQELGRGQGLGVPHDGDGTCFQEPGGVQGCLGQIAVLGDVLEIFETVQTEKEVLGSRVLVFIVVQDSSVSI